MTLNPLLMAALLAASFAGTAHAAKLPIFDNFNDSNVGIDSTKWRDSESLRFIDTNGKLTLGRWTYGSNTSDTGFTSENFNITATDNAPAKVLKVTVVANSLEPTPCAANTTASAVQARTIGAFFSTRAGGPVAGDATGDVLALIGLRRASDSLDAPQVMRVVTNALNCTNADCTTFVSLGSNDLGTAMPGDKVVLQITWNEANSKFQFSRDGGTPAEVSHAAVTKTGPPGRPFNNVSIRNATANCTASRVRAGMEASFDDFAIGR